MRVRLTVIVMVFAILTPLNNPVYGDMKNSVDFPVEVDSSINPEFGNPHTIPKTEPEAVPEVQDPVYHPYVPPKKDTLDQDTEVDPDSAPFSNPYAKPKPPPESVNNEPTSNAGDALESLKDPLSIMVNTIGEVGTKFAKKGFGVGDKVVTGLDVIGNMYYGHNEDAAASLANGILGGIVTTGGAMVGTFLLGPGGGTTVGAIVGAGAHTYIIQPLVGDVVHAVLPIDEAAALRDKMKYLAHVKALGNKLIDDYNIPPGAVEQAMTDYLHGKKNALIDLRNERLNAMKKNEVSTQIDLESLDDKLNKMPINQTFFNDKYKDADGKVLQGFDFMDTQNDLENTATASDDAKAQAANMRNEAGEDAMDITKQAANESADLTKKNSMGNIIGNEIIDGIENGGKTGGSTIGDAAGHIATKEIFDNNNSTPKPGKPAGKPSGVSPEPGESTCTGE